MNSKVTGVNLNVKAEGVGGKYSKPGRLVSLTSTPNVNSNLQSFGEISLKDFGKISERNVAASSELDHFMYFFKSIGVMLRVFITFTMSKIFKRLR